MPRPQGKVKIFTVKYGEPDDCDSDTPIDKIILEHIANLRPRVKERVRYNELLLKARELANKR